MKHSVKRVRKAEGMEKFIASYPTRTDITDEEIQAEVNAVRYGK